MQRYEWFLSPAAPVGGLHNDPLLVRWVDPPARNTAARKHERMFAVRIEDRKLQVLLKRCSRDWLPHDGIFRTIPVASFDLHQTTLVAINTPWGNLHYKPDRERDFKKDSS